MTSSFNHFDDTARVIKPAIKRVVRKVALDVQSNAAANAPVDTGFLRNSIYTVTSDSSDYRGGQRILPSVNRPTSETEAYVAVGAEYGIHQEFGTRFMPARPYFYPAIERAKPGFENAMELIKQKMEEAAQ